MLLTKIISGGQTGADQGALRAALSLHLQTGGWAPKGWRTETGPQPSLADYGLIEHSSASYPGRTLTNAIASDGTLWFGNQSSPGGHVTLRSAANARKPVYVFAWPKVTITEADNLFLDWMIHNKIIVLNVAGNRESTNPGIGEAVEQYLLLNITTLREISP